jgi:hypothetical protein
VALLKEPKEGLELTASVQGSVRLAVRDRVQQERVTAPGLVSTRPSETPLPAFLRPRRGSSGGSVMFQSSTEDCNPREATDVQKAA